MDFRRLLRSGWFVPVVLALLGLPAPVHALDAGTSMFALQLVHGQADIAAPQGPYLSAYTHGELGIGGEYWYLFGDQLAVAVAGRYDRGRERQSADGQVDRYYRQWSWSGRVGLDRVTELGDRAVFYFGPGLEYWRGKAEFLGIYGAAPPLFEVTTPETQRVSLSARFGAILVLGESWGLSGHLGHLVGVASADGSNARTSWYTNGWEAAAGIVLAFGGEE